jgi:hypothetical protein
MTIIAEKKFAVDIVYNGITKQLQMQPEERVTSVLHRAIAIFGVTQNPHLLSLFRQDGSVLPDNESVERAGLKPGEILLLRPDTVRGGVRGLRLAKDLVDATFRTLRECGRGECECAVYWTGPADTDLVDGLEHPVHTRSPFGYEVDSNWLTELWKRLAVSKRSIRVQVHTHPNEAFHSASDDKWPIVSQVGFISIVIPDFASGKASLDGVWVGCLQENGKWQRLSSAAEAVMPA